MFGIGVALLYRLHIYQGGNYRFEDIYDNFVGAWRMIFQAPTKTFLEEAESLLLNSKDFGWKILIQALQQSLRQLGPDEIE